MWHQDGRDIPWKVMWHWEGGLYSLFRGCVSGYLGGTGMYHEKIQWGVSRKFSGISKTIWHFKKSQGILNRRTNGNWVQLNSRTRLVCPTRSYTGNTFNEYPIQKVISRICLQRKFHLTVSITNPLTMPRDLTVFTS